MSEPVLDVRHLSVTYRRDGRTVQALDDVSLTVGRGEVVGIIGESGSGKSTLALSILRLLPQTAGIKAEALRLAGTDMLTLSERELEPHRGRTAAMVFQDPMTSFNPVFTVGEQLADFLYREPALGRAGKRRLISEMLLKVGIPDPERRLAAYPHQFSGGMLQRLAIAAALMMRPVLLIADEPTTALDVTMEAQILHLMRRLKEEILTSILIVSHHLGVIAELCDRVAVMYAGEVVEAGTVTEVFERPSHPYTRSLFRCDPAMLREGARRLPVIGGEVPNLSLPRQGCSFAPRCALAEEACRTGAPPRRARSASHDFLCRREVA